MRVVLTALLIIGLIGTGNLTFAGEQKTLNTEATEESMENNEYKGMVMKVGQDYTLLVGDKSYLLKGKKLEKLDGKIVKINGKLEKTQKGDSIIVAKAKIIK